MASMDLDILLFFGGIGLFLLGMIMLAEGLRGLAGNALRRLLARFTKTPLRGAAAGALTTALIQSSSATTVTAVGFVGAGLLTFPQGLGIVFGANIGTTITGWLVAILGFKLQLGLIVLPLVLVGALFRLFGNARLRHVGWAMAGFGLLFVGIDAMQQGMAQFEGTVSPDNFPEDTFFGRLQLVLIGIVITLVTQSSSAGVATALVALGAGTISFAQAAALVIGMDVGTTFTAALATIGGSTAMRQTGYAHVIYNVLTGIMAFFLLDLFSAAIEAWTSHGDAQIALVAFHTTFNAVGVILVLPFARPFARLITRLVPERGPPLLRRLDDRLLRDPASAVDAAAATVRDITVVLIGILTNLLGLGTRTQFDSARPDTVEEALRVTRRFVEQIRTEPAQQHTHRRHIATMHALDHLSRLLHRCTQTARIETLATGARLRRLASVLRDTAVALLEDHDSAAAEKRFDRLRVIFREQRHTYRERTVATAAVQRIGAHSTLQRLDGIRWLHRVAYHLWRIVLHLRRAEEQSATEREPGEPPHEEEED